MSDSPYLPPVRLEAHRERIVARLAEHFAHDHLDTDEFERRLDLAYRATTLAELDGLQADLPALGSEQATAPARAGGAALARDVAERQLVVAIMSGAERKGVWTPARNVEVVAVMGGVELDFREARFGRGVTQVNVLAIMGGVEITVPPGLRVESSGFGIMGGFESLNQGSSLGDDDMPVLRITGLAVMGGVEISERFPGESLKEAKLRRREERKQLRREGRRLKGGE
jgi:hypothetical protein